jgi:hypothetical protein
VGLERAPLSLLSTIEELLERKSNGSGLENRKYGHRDLSRRPRGTLYPQTLALISRTGGGRSVGIVPSRTEAKEFFSVCAVFVCIVGNYAVLRLQVYVHNDIGEFPFKKIISA